MLESESQATILSRPRSVTPVLCEHQLNVGDSGRGETQCYARLRWADGSSENFSQQPPITNSFITQRTLRLRRTGRGDFEFWSRHGDELGEISVEVAT